ncbi:MAG: HEPN domain-containing protein [Prolixibacteraceae bacterium]
MNEATQKYIQQWIAKAAVDLVVIEKLTEFEVIATSAVCFHCQQVVEKYLKVFLIANGIDIKKTHNIEFLLAECSDIDPEFSEIDPSDLNDYGVDIRYPGDLYSPSEAETLEHKKLTISIKDLVEKKIARLL